MKSLPANIIIEKNKLATPSAWLILLDISLPDGSKFYLVKNNENVTFNSQVYTALNFDVEPTKASAQGEIPTVTLRVSNVTRVLQDYLESTNGGVGATVTLRVVNSAYLSENYSELTMTFDVLATVADAYWVSFTLGAPNPLRWRFPLNRYIANHCNWQYKSAECGYSGTASTCKRTLQDCRDRFNSGRYGGYMGMSTGGVRLV